MYEEYFRTEHKRSDQSYAHATMVPTPPPSHVHTERFPSMGSLVMLEGMGTRRAGYVRVAPVCSVCTYRGA